MKRRRLTVWLVLLVAAHGARTADPQNPDDVTATTPSEPRGEKKFGDKCEATKECGFDNSVCDSHTHSCQCIPDYPATNHIDKCGPEVRINESCFFNEQCEIFLAHTECRDMRCTCRFELTAYLVNKDTDKWECRAPSEPAGQERYVDPTMIMILVAMALMFIIICVVLHLFSKARWRENRTIFNTPNPRLMNVSLLRENKHPGERRGSRGSVRAPSRQPSMASLRPQSPNATQGSPPSRSGSRGSSTSLQSPNKMAITNNITLVASKLADGDSKEPKA